MKRDFNFKYDTPQYHLIRAMDNMAEASEKAAEAFNNLIDALRYGANEYDSGDFLSDAKGAVADVMSKAFSAVMYLDAAFVESVAAEEKKGEADGNEEEG